MQRGPVTEDELGDLIKDGIISPETRVWREGMSDWYPVSEVQELAQKYLGKNSDVETKSGVEKNGGSDVSASASAAAMSKVPQLPQSSRAAEVYTGSEPMPPTYNVQAIIGLVMGVLCCTPIAGPAIVAIVHGSKVGRLYASGDYEGALEASGKAKQWCNYTGAALAVAVILWIILMFLGVLSEGS